MKKNKPIFKTYDAFVVDAISEIEPATQKQIAKRLDVTESSVWSMLKRLCREELIFVDITHKPYQYAVKERAVSYD